MTRKSPAPIPVFGKWIVLDTIKGMGPGETRDVKDGEGLPNYPDQPQGLGRLP